MAQVEGSGTADMLKSPVLAPATSRVIPTPMVSENGLTAGVSVAFAVPEKAAPLKGPTVPNRFASEKSSAVSLVPPQARPVTVPLSR